MRPDHPSGHVVDLDGEELEELIEQEQPQPFAETEELDLSRENPPLKPPSADGLRTGPGRSNPPPSEPLLPLVGSRPLASARTEPSQPIVPVRTEPMREESIRAAPRRGESLRPGSHQVPAVTGPLRPDPTASMRKNKPRAATSGSGSMAAAKRQRLEAARSVVRKPRSSKPEEAVDELLGVSLGSYRIISLIGEGGMGRVYQAEHVKLGRKVALKLLRPEYAVKRDAVSRFFKEAQAVNKIRHENIVDITDFVELESGETYIIMELLQGDDLADLTRKADQPMPLHRAMQIALQVCDALEAAHRVGVIHRDLKPDNIFILNTPTRKDFVKLLDFGVAKLLGESAESDGWQTAAGSVIGTPAYMSPEQASGIPVDARSDIYSLGAILYELFTGHPVFRAKSFGEYVVKHMNDDPVPPRDLANAPRIPAALEHVILRCLEKDPNRRYPSVTDLRDDLARATATVQTMVETIALGSKPAPSRGRRRALIAIPVALGVTGLAVVAFWLASGLSIDEVTRERDPYRSIGPRPRQNPAGDPGGVITRTEPLGTRLTESAKLTLITEPRGASVFRKGEASSLGRTPLDLQLSEIGEELEFTFRLDGYEDAVEKVLITDNALYSIPLERKLGGKPAATGKRPPRLRVIRRGNSKQKTVEPDQVPEEKPQPQPKPGTKKPGKVNPEDVVDPFET